MERSTRGGRKATRKVVKYQDSSLHNKSLFDVMTARAHFA
jgi:hypothetical protein